MCQHCAEAQGLELLAAGLRGGDWSLAAQVPWAMPVLVQEGAPEGVAPPGAAPLSRALLDAERSGASWRGLLRAEHPLAPAWNGGGAGEEPLEAVALLHAYAEWADSLPLFAPPAARAEAGAALEEAFPALWTAWRLAARRSPRATLVPAVRALCRAPPPPTAELLGLWLARRAALVWEQLEGWEPLLEHYVARPAAVLFVAFRRPPADPDREALGALLSELGDEQTGGWALA